MPETRAAHEPSIADRIATWAENLGTDDVPPPVRATLTRVLIDATGLMIAARDTPYVKACVAAKDGTGDITALGHDGGFTTQDAALISGTAVHGEDFDDTFEGTPVHVGAVLVPALLAAAETNRLSGADILRGLAVGGELSCRMAIVAPTAIHRAGFHPTAVIGAIGAAAGVATALRLHPKEFASALGIAGSMASGIIEYLAEGTSTKRLHPGWAAQCGIKAAGLAKAGFDGPRTVLEGTHGFFKGFADPAIPPDFDKLTAYLGDNWLAAGLAFKPYACGTMVQPFIDCAIKLKRQGIAASEIRSVMADVGEGTVHRLWEPLEEKRNPSTSYSAKFSVPYGIAIGLIDGAAGLNQFTDARIADTEVRELSRKVAYTINPDDPYPASYTGTLHVTLASGRTIDAHQPFLRGGVREPLSDDELVAKFNANVTFGGWNTEQAHALLEFATTLFDAPDVSALRQFRT